MSQSKMGLSHRFLGINQYSGKLMYLAQGQNGAVSGDQTKDLSIRRSVRFRLETAGTRLTTKPYEFVK